MLKPEGDGSMLTVDALAQEIRRVDGSKSLGAGALAEALMPFVSRAPSPSPAPGVVEALDIAKRIRENAGGTTAHIIAANDAHNFLERFASLYQPAKGEREGGERSQGHYDRDGYCDNPARGY
jgi:hypothetical protein